MTILILGAGGHGQVVVDILLASAQINPDSARSLSFLDDDERLWGKSVLGTPVLGPISSVTKHPHSALLLGIGNNRTRQSLFARLQAEGEKFAIATHPSAMISSGVKIEPGAVICAGVVVNVGSKIGHNTILNTGCTVDHHCTVGNHTHIAPGVNLGGDVVIEAGVLVGIGATVMPQRRLKQWSTVGAGAVVTTNVGPNTSVIGVPAKTINLKP